MSNNYIGAHILGNKSILENIKECKSINGNAIQIFLKSPIKSNVKINLTKTDISSINKYIKTNNMFLITHGSYMLNMCWPIHRNRWAIQSLKDDLIMTSQLGGFGVVIHMGQNTPKLKLSMRDALSNFVKSISSILDDTPEECKLLLETSCNQKNSIAGKIEDLAKIWKMFDKKYYSRLSFCIDTAHIFVAGYPIHKKNGFKSYINDFDKYIGIENISLFHVNDSATKFDSAVDRHSGIGFGYIYKRNSDRFVEVVEFCLGYGLNTKSKLIPMILETHGDYKKEIELIHEIKSNKLATISRNTAKSNNIKNKIIMILEQLAKHELNTGHLYKNIAYLRAIKNLKEFDGDITTIKPTSITGVGTKIAAKIKEIIETGKLKQVEEIEDSIYNVMGIGNKLATILRKKYKITTIPQLKKLYESKKIKLTKEQILGIKYYKHLQLKIPREEADKYKGIIQKILPQNVDMIITGSYRRGKHFMGDIDILLTMKEYQQKIPIGILQNIINKLKLIIIDSIGIGETKYSGLISLSKKDIVRRLDVRLVPYDSYYTSLLYFTGSKLFNQTIRGLAKKRGFLLNEYGLYKITNSQKIKLNITSEEDIFKKLQIKYVLPNKR